MGRLRETECLCKSSEASFADRLKNPTAYDALIPSRRKTLSHNRQTRALLVHEETQTSGRLSSASEVTATPKEESMKLPQQPPTSSVLEIENLSCGQAERD